MKLYIKSPYHKQWLSLIAISVLYIFMLSTIIELSSCKISDCQKAEEAVYARYRYALQHDGIRNDSNRNEIIRSEEWYDMTFDCKHHYTKRYIRKHLGKPMRIYINNTDNWLGKNYFYEDWLYPAGIEYHPNKKPFIGSLLILRFEFNKPRLKENGKCPSDTQSSCREYTIAGDPERDVDWIFNLINLDSFDLKYPYILKNEQKFYSW